MSNTEYCRHGVVPDDCHVCYVANLEAERDEADRLREEWRKADDGWIACKEQLQGALALVRLLYDQFGEERIAVQLGTETLERFQVVLGIDTSSG